MGMTRIAIIGGGKIGEALIAGLRDGGWPPQDLVVVETGEARAAELKDRYSIMTSDLAIAAEGAQVIVVAVKPNDVPGVIDKVDEAISDSVHEAVVVSLAAGVPTEAIESRLSAGSPVVRVMPNTAMLVGEGTSAICKGRFARGEHIDLVRKMMGSVGATVEVTESQMDAVTALSGSGPAYFFLLAEAMIEAGVEQGIPRKTAETLVLGTAKGAGAMLAAGGDGPTALRAAVTSPGGTTAAALRAFESGGLRATVYGAVSACKERSAALADEVREQMIDELSADQT
ncbi:Pyrroline-5-carboxylate reductase [Dietzia timorensis]|uniref:Pyrroline-5-carboxylate reductase n=2 Tax=Dietzia timorensis TaxID=499555 RepID=A0A173LR76_9ACTN|nr:Pyrroline-5-carboxylate reductase [Dietzia timorensis]